MNIRIKPLSQTTLPAFLNFFDNTGFTDNPDWASCYCVFFHHPGSTEDWMRTTKDSNREEAIELVRAGKLQGFIAFDGYTPVAFCNANRKTAFTFDKNRARVCGDADSETVSIVCFIVAPDYRRNGIGSLLLRTAIESYTNKGIRRFEAYPSKNATKDCEHYHGPVSLYLKCEFQVAEEYDDYMVMRRTDE